MNAICGKRSFLFMEWGEAVRFMNGHTESDLL